MKLNLKGIAFLLLILFSSHVKGQFVNIPDTNFVNWLNANGFSSCMNGNLMDTTCNSITSATSIEPWSSNIHDLTGVQYFDNLQTLYCGNNPLTFLPPLPTTLYDLDCNRCQLTSLPSLPPNLGYLICYQNYLTSLPTIPNSISNLDCSYNQITALPPLGNATYLDYLTCDYNLLTSLPTLPVNLFAFKANHNLLTSLPFFPGSVINQVRANQITTIAGWPSGGISIFECDSNLLTTLPVFPYAANYGDMSFSSNLLTYIPPLPAYVSTLNIDNNPISCLPQIFNLQDLSWNNTQIACLPNACSIVNATPSINSLPICNPLSGCDFFYNVYGKVYLDNNSNCQLNINDVPLVDIPIILDSAGAFSQLMTTTVSGKYSFDTNFGNHTTKLGTNYFDIVCPPSGVNTFSITASDSIAENTDFAVHCPSNYDLIAQSLCFLEPVKPGSTETIFINAGEGSTFFGASCFNIGGNVKLVLSGPASYLSPTAGALTPTSINGDSIEWSVADFTAIDPKTAFNIIVSIDTNAFIGDSVCLDLSLSPFQDKDSTNNTSTSCFPVVSSFDPNEKFMIPSGAVDSSQQWFTFTIFFQNTGTAQAEDIYILDSLSDKLDASTFTYLASSHDVTTQLLPGNVLRFNYANINLPDSNANEPLSHGYVQFKVKRKQGLPIGTIISNTSYIYFDFNPAIVTNTVSATLTIPSALHELVNSSFNVFPNPTSGIVSVYFNNEIKFVQVFNLLGEQVLEKEVSANANYAQLNLNFLPKGVYIIKAGNINKRIIKL